MIRLPFWSGAGRRKTSASPPGGGPPLPPHIGDYVIHSEARIFWNFRPEIVQRPSLRHARKQDFYHSEARKTSASAPGEDPPPPHPLDLLDLMDPLYPMDLTDLTDPKHSSP